MRDPRGSIEFRKSTVARKISIDQPSLGFLKSPRASELVKSGDLISYDFQKDVIVSPRLAFVSYPHEWCDEQLRRAAHLTLELSRKIEPLSYELKDASAWNVIFEGNRPVFCDLYSFQPIETKRWWAFGQFIRHFVLPLLISKQRGLKPHQQFSFYRDGIPPDAAKKLLGLKRYLTRYWPLMVTGKPSYSVANVKKEDEGKPLHQSLYRFCSFLLNGLSGKNRQGHWSDYTVTRDHYSSEASRLKFQTLDDILQKLSPAWVVDLGCNTGEFSKLAAKHGANVIAIDLDHDSIQDIVFENSESKNIFPLVVNLADMVGGRGWCGREFPSLVERLRNRADVLLMLALIHHLMISESIALKDVAQLAADISSKYLVVELLDETDPMVIHLCLQRNRLPQEFTLGMQKQAFEKHFKLIESHDVSGGQRQICVFQKR